MMVQGVLCFSETMKGQKTALTFRTIELTKHKSITTTNRSAMNTYFQSKFNSNRPCHFKHFFTSLFHYDDYFIYIYIYIFFFLLSDEETMALFKKHVSDPKTNARKSALEV